jgi:hypothetical protein
MIEGIPDHQDLTETATGWLNLAWDFAVGEAENFQEVEHLYQSMAVEHGQAVADRVVEKHWRAKRLKLNNAISLLQQSLEIFIKARIAEVSPFLLIAGDPQSWPSPDKSGKVDFAEFRTLDSVHLCRAARVVSPSALSDDFVQFYNRLRKERNKIVHLNAASMKAEVSTIIIDVLEAHKLLYPAQMWVEFRREYLIDSGEYSDTENVFSGDDYTNDKLTSEVEAAFGELEPRYKKRYFGYDPRKQGLRCPKCLGMQDRDDDWAFAQKQKDGSIKCCVCLTNYDQVEYEQGIINHFGYLDEDEQAEIVTELKTVFRAVKA